MIGRLDRYVVRFYLSSWLVCLVFFLGFFGVLDFVGDLGDLTRSDHAASMVARFYLLKMPSVFLQVAPFIMLGAALMTVTRLQKHNEFLAMVLTGRSSLRVLVPVFACTVAFILVQVAAQEFVAPRCALERGRLDSIIIQRDRAWIIPEIALRDARNRMILARDFDVNAQTVARLLVTYRDESGDHVRIEGEDATWDPRADGWRLREGTLTITPPERDAESRSEPIAFYPTNVRPEDLQIEDREPFDLSYGDVLALSERYPLSRSYRLLRHFHVTYPLSILLLVLLGVPFVVRRGARNPMTGIGYAMGLCMGYMIFTATVRDLGIRGIIPWPVIAAWLPVIVAGSLVVVFYDSAEL